MGGCHEGMLHRRPCWFNIPRPTACMWWITPPVPPGDGEGSPLGRVRLPD
jgi:hypothetical protein